MNSLLKLQNDFLNYLLDSEHSDIVMAIASSPQRSAEQRMTLYGSAYILRLKEALSSDYERLHAYLGDELFDHLMRQYIKRYPSQHPSLRYFGQHMLELVEQLPPFNQLVEVAEITRIEQAFANSFDAADCQCVLMSELAILEPQAWADLKLKFNDAVQVLPLTMNSFQIWKALANDELPPAKEPDASSWLIWRQQLVSRYRPLEEAELAALHCAISGASFAEVCEALLAYFDEQQTPLRAVGYLQQWINEQMVCQLI
ncbi:MAG: DNA-binding domain-containing protein [Gammaproteobacteria bacterium]|nr:DNA-binding domain-containing protein [Gammaproteobacteria bacterium]